MVERAEKWADNIFVVVLLLILALVSESRRKEKKNLEEAVVFRLTGILNFLPLNIFFLWFCIISTKDLKI